MVYIHSSLGVQVADPKTLEPVPEDGRTIGEVLVRGNLVMNGKSTLSRPPTSRLHVSFDSLVYALQVISRTRKPPKRPLMGGGSIRETWQWPIRMGGLS